MASLLIRPVPPLVRSLTKWLELHAEGLPRQRRAMRVRLVRRMQSSWRARLRKRRVRECMETQWDRTGKSANMRTAPRVTASARYLAPCRQWHAGLDSA